MIPSIEKNSINYLTSKQIEEVKKAFQIFDQDGSDSISVRVSYPLKQEFDQILKSLGQSLSDEELQLLIQEIDQDGNGFIDFEEFLTLVAPYFDIKVRKIIGNRSDKIYVEAFRMINSSNRGKLTFPQLVKANQVTKAGLTETEINDIINYVNEKHKGSLDVGAMLKMLFRIPQSIN